MAVEEEGVCPGRFQAGDCTDSRVVIFVVLVMYVHSLCTVYVWDQVNCYAESNNRIIPKCHMKLRNAVGFVELSLMRFLYMYMLHVMYV